MDSSRVVRNICEYGRCESSKEIREECGIDKPVPGGAREVSARRAHAKEFGRGCLVE